MRRIAILVSILIGLALCQMPYGPSQLDLYFRLLRNQNLGGFGNLANAESRILTAERQQFLSGLPPLPMTHDEVIRVLTTESPTSTIKPTARPTTPPPPVADPFAVNNTPEGPPVPEERIGGTYDEDGNFVSATNLVTERKRNLARGARNYQLSDTATTRQYGYVAQFHQPVHHPQNRVIRQHTTPRPFTFPPLVFRAKPQPTNRDTYLNNLLLEIEEYDDFLDQVNQYKTRYPGAQVPNPYRSLPEGKLPALAQYKKKK
ncbi:hypothetical protein GCK72_023359 [Caenorhabditis remanei]|nr:hypothetical protein GCK72_023359 [Caenorhabditis remanei]KAF1746901.1 hypothetical protein GCK72_023359 [Caenorhabditis remanei]